MAINVQELKGHWNELKGQVKQRWGQLTEDDLKWVNGNVDQLIGRIQQRTGEERMAVENFLQDLTSQGATMISQAAQSVGDYAHQASNRLRGQYDQLADQFRDRYDNAQEIVRHNPGQAIAVAFGIGVVAGLLIAPAFRSR